MEGFLADIHDVAKLAGVSIKTVSRVINHEQGVREITRARVQKAIDKLQYTPHIGARLMRSSKSNLIGLISSTISTVSRDPVKSGLSSIHIVSGIQQYCRKANKTLLIIDTEPDEEDIKSSIDIFRSHQVEGIFHILNYHHQVSPLQYSDTPFWIVNGYSNSQTAAVVPDDYHGQKLAVEYLLQQGHTRIGYIGLSTSIEAGKLRLKGFQETIQQYDLPYDLMLTELGIKNASDNSFSLLHEALDKLLKHASPPTAICFGNDEMALQAIPILEKRGLNIPDDISIMGYDNDFATAAAARPKLTTVSLPYQRMGQIAAENLLRQLQDPDAESKFEDYPIKVKGEVVVRESVRALSSIKIASKKII